MKKRSYTIISAVISLVFAAAIANLIAGFYIDKQSGPEETLKKYQELKTETAIASQQFEPGTGEFSSKFLEILGPAEDYAQIMLTLNGKTIYRYPPENVEVNLDLTRTYSESIVTLYGNTLEITASLYTVKPSSIFYHGRLSFLLILAGTVCALLILLVTKVVEDQNSTSGYWKYTEDNGIQNNSEKPLFSHEENESTVNAAPAPEYNDEPAAEQYTSEEPETAVEPGTPIRQEETQATEAPAEEEFKEPEIFGNSDSDSQEQKNLSEALDERDPIEQNYYLEVSSPGMDRELVKPEHFRLCKGQEVEGKTYVPLKLEAPLTEEEGCLDLSGLKIKEFAGELLSYTEEPEEKVAVRTVIDTKANNRKPGARVSPSALKECIIELPLKDIARIGLAVIFE